MKETGKQTQIMKIKITSKNFKQTIRAKKFFPMNNIRLKTQKINKNFSKFKIGLFKYARQ